MSPTSSKRGLRLSFLAVCFSLAFSGFAQAQTYISPETGTVIGRAPTVATATISGTPSGAGGVWLAGDVLTANYTLNDLDLDPTDTTATDLTIQWTSGGANVGTPGSKTYTLQAADAGKVITFKLIPRTDAATTDPFEGALTIADNVGSDGGGGSGNGGGGGSITPADGTTLMSVTISGSPQVAGTLTANPACIATCSGVTYQWQLETGIGTGVFANIAGATNVSYTPVRTDQKRKVKVVATK